MKQIEVRIMGQGYLLSCPDNGEAQLLDAVGRVDAAMCRIRDAGKVKALDRIAVLASLNLAFELSEAQTRCERELTEAVARHQLELDQVKLALAQTKHNLAEATASLNALAQAPAPIQTPEPVDQLTAETEANLANLMQRMDTVLASAAVPQPSETAVETPADTPVGSLADTAVEAPADIPAESPLESAVETADTELQPEAVVS